MKFINVLDEHGRFIELKAYVNGNSQENSRTYSYLGARRIYEELNKEPIGFGIEKQLDEIERLKELKRSNYQRQVFELRARVEDRRSPE